MIIDLIGAGAGAASFPDNIRNEPNKSISRILTIRLIAWGPQAQFVLIGMARTHTIRRAFVSLAFLFLLFWMSAKFLHFISISHELNLTYTLTCWLLFHATRILQPGLCAQFEHLALIAHLIPKMVTDTFAQLLLVTDTSATSKT